MPPLPPRRGMRMPLLLMCEVCHAKSEETLGYQTEWDMLRRVGWVCYSGHVWCPKHRNLSIGGTRRERRKRHALAATPRDTSGVVTSGERRI